MIEAIEPHEVPAAEKWPLLVEAKAIFGPVVAAELAEAMGLVQSEVQNDDR